ncbi:IS1 family transposase, partial [Escherichia coli]|uniref:IS1 family transposase n=1 Tax=Escherichia coli TaxID=562 RepID=UPI002378196F
MELLLSLRIRSLIFLQKLIGRNNLTQRTRIKRLARRIIYFSRTVVPVSYTNLTLPTK